VAQFDLANSCDQYSPRRPCRGAEYARPRLEILPKKLEPATSRVERRFLAATNSAAAGRSLRQLDLETRLFRNPCSYMVYSDAFDALPSEAKAAIYERMSDILSGRDKNPRYGRFSAVDRQAIIEILRDTKKDLPTTFAKPS